MSCQSLLSLNNKVAVDNFYFDYRTLSLTLNLIQTDDCVIIAGSDSTRHKIHILIINKLTKKEKHYYILKPFNSKPKYNSNLTSFMAGNRPEEFIAVFNNKYILYLRTENDSLILYDSIFLNHHSQRPYYYYFNPNDLVGIYPVITFKDKNKCYYFKDSLKIDFIDKKSRGSIYYNSTFGTGFNNTVNSSYISTIPNKNSSIVISYALKNELLILDLKNGDVDTIKNLIQDFKEINRRYFDSIQSLIPMNKAIGLTHLHDSKQDFNLIFKIMSRNEYEFWIVWLEREPNTDFKFYLDIVFYDTFTKKWTTKIHKMDCGNQTLTEITSQSNNSINYFNNINSIYKNQFCLLNFESQTKSQKQTLNLYQFSINQK